MLDSAPLDQLVLEDLLIFCVCFFLQEAPVNCERYLNWANAFVVVYSIDNRKSFEGCQQYLDILALHSKNAQHESPIILVGNKLDMEQYR